MPYSNHPQPIRGSTVKSNPDRTGRHIGPYSMKRSDPELLALMLADIEFINERRQRTLYIRSKS
ncbi:hypothetical protein [Bifidobacterium sp. SO1]|uniref:hypothetical protein n=1 Tax=Bifidobacterium sp. SO1 TaxID=2809029 RepID=UPI001BDD448C|nr:hypothetical protein [Bifidobacterium sp. SO1]MBT1161259.1 hypothetical protein [Bifidobacterium sp. SO1]